MWEELHESSNRRVGLNVKMTNARNQMEFCIYKLWVGNKCKFIQSHKFYSKSVCVCAFSPSSQSEREEFETEYKQEYERERVLLTEEKKKLSSELDKVPHLYLYTKWLSAHKPGSSLSVFSELSTHTNAALWPQLTPNSFITFLLHPRSPTNAKEITVQYPA